MNIFTRFIQLFTKPVQEPQVQKRYRVEPRLELWVVMDGERPTIFRFPTRKEAQAFADHFNQRDQKNKAAQAVA